jgi:hypothetical protein
MRFLEGGQVGPTDLIFSRPANETVARLLGAESVAQGAAATEDCVAIGAGVLLKVTGPKCRTGNDRLLRASQ